jgi:hypothetical protein
MWPFVLNGPLNLREQLRKSSMPPVRSPSSMPSNGPAPSPRIFSILSAILSPSSPFVFVDMLTQTVIDVGDEDAAH